MEKETTLSRLSSLDGLRGFAIILVFLNHINAGFITKYLTPWLFGWIFADGVTGVTFLFILSGFLMQYIYPNPSGLQFLQKRYTRIFPLFITMSLIMWLYRLFPHLEVSIFIAALIAVSFLVHVLWKGIQKMPSIVGKVVFKSFIVLQVLVGGFYVLWVMKQTPVVFNYLIPAYIRETTIWLVNATLTLPLGNYIPMLDGVYWSLAAEILFYILYPYIVSPMVRGLIPQKRIVKVIFLLCLLPFFGGLEILSHHMFLLSLLQPELFMYFATGIALGYLYKNKKEQLLQWTSLSKRFSLVPVIIFIFLMIAVHDSGMLVNQVLGPWVRLLYAIPLTCLVALVLDSRTSIAKFFSMKGMVFIGTISYSIYLGHSLVIHLVENLFHPTNIFNNTIYICAAFGIVIAVASFLFLLLEKPYFKKSAKKQHAYTPVIGKSHLRPVIIFSTVTVVCFLAIFFAYQSNANFFSIQYPIRKSAFLTTSMSQLSNEFSLTNNKKLTMVFQSQDDNLGLLTLHITHRLLPQETLYPRLTFSIKEKGAPVWYASAGYELSKFDSGIAFPFGFPVITSAKGKWYVVELSLIKATPGMVTIYTNSLTSIFPANKGRLLKSPFYMVNFLKGKIATVVENREAALVALCLIPFFIFTCWYLYKEQRKYFLVRR